MISASESEKCLRRYFAHLTPAESRCGGGTIQLRERVNVTGDGRLVVAAYADGTIRWHRMDDGRELLALQLLSDKKNLVAWTPEGFYDATAGAYGVLKWHVNRGNEAAADTVHISAIPRLKRPDNSSRADRV